MKVLHAIFLGLIFAQHDDICEIVRRSSKSKFIKRYLKATYPLLYASCNDFQDSKHWNLSKINKKRTKISVLYCEG